MTTKAVLLKSIGQNLRNIRKQNNLEVKEVAGGLQISVQAYGAIENGKVDINMSRLIQIAEYYKMTVFEILPSSCIYYNDQNNTTNKNDDYKTLQTTFQKNMRPEDFKTHIKAEIVQMQENITFLVKTFM